MKLLVWVSNVKEHYNILNELNQAIVRKFREYDIEIPFPQRDINFRNTIPESDTEKEAGQSEKENKDN